VSKQFENLFKDLANGMSRRTAIRRFVGGVAGVAAAVLTGRRAAADSAGVCARWCADQYSGYPDAGLYIAACIDSSSECPDGQCASGSDLSWAKTSNNQNRPYLNNFVCMSIQ
jgi:hypothetical protein